MTQDPRYQQIDLPDNFSLSEYELQKENGVLQRLELIPHYTFSVFPGSSIKHNKLLYIYQRPTINWSIECEGKGYSR